MATPASADPSGGKHALALALLCGAAAGFNRLLLGLIARGRAVDEWEGLRFAVAQCAALFAIHPYIQSALLGAGDAASYSLTVADFLQQARAGIFPVLIGQSDFAFSGGFQPLRNAPLLPHLAWAFDLLGAGSFNAFALLNLTVVASMMGAVLGCYAALRIHLGRYPWLALGLAFLYGLCPGALAPLYGGDMYPTFLTLPFIPWLALGISRSVTTPERMWPWVLQGAALAAMWLAHPPVAAWATCLAGVMGAWTLLRVRTWRTLRAAILALGIFLILGGYLFVSVTALHLPAVARADALATISYKILMLRVDWMNSLLPVSAGGNHLLGDVQLGYGLWACLLVALPWALRFRAGRTLLACFALIVLFAWPIPVLTRHAWRSLPTELLVVTNQWPTERFYVLLDVLAVFIVAAAFARLCARGRRETLAVGVLLVAACAWSAAEARKFFVRAAAIGNTVAASEAMHRPENITLSRTHSYEYLGTPSFFSGGHMDPRMETRLLDRVTRLPFADGSTPVPWAAHKGRTFELTDEGAGGFKGSVTLQPGESRVLRFDFLGQNPVGEFRIIGNPLYNFYALPASGKAGAFGSGPDASHTLIVQNTTAAPERLTFQFAGKGSGRLFARVSDEPMTGRDRAIQLVSLTPFRALVTTERNAYLETPKLFVPGYEATVDGAPAPFTRSADGLIALPLAVGTHDITLRYVGSSELRWSYSASAFAWLMLFAVTLVFAFRKEEAAGRSLAQAFQWDAGPERAATGAAVVIAVLLLTATGAAIGIMLRPVPRQSFGVAALSVRLPWPILGQVEPLVTTGTSGKGDFISVAYVDGTHVVVGHDKWGYGGARSRPIEVDYDRPQLVEVGMSSLYEGNASLPSTPSRPHLFVKWNGVLVLSEDATAWPSAPENVSFGKNLIGGSSSTERFSGAFLSVTRKDPAGAPFIPTSDEYGVADLALQLPWPVIGKTEPLVATGHTGAGDFISVTYADAGHVVVSHDKWDHGGGRSDPIAVDYDKPQQVEIGMTSLYRGNGAQGAVPRLFVKWNGVVVLSERVAAWPSSPGEVTFGENRIGGSSTADRFTGILIGVTRWGPSGPK